MLIAGKGRSFKIKLFVCLCIFFRIMSLAIKPDVSRILFKLSLKRAICDVYLRTKNNSRKLRCALSIILHRGFLMNRRFSPRIYKSSRFFAELELSVNRDEFRLHEPFGSGTIGRINKIIYTRIFALRENHSRKLYQSELSRERGNNFLITPRICPQLMHTQHEKLELKPVA